MIRSICLALLAAVLLNATSLTCHAQQGNRRREFIQGLLKTFIESQLPDERQPNPANRPTNTNRPTGRPSQQSAEITRAAQLLKSASEEMSLLVESLQGDVYRTRGVRELLNLAFKVNSDAAVLSRRLAYGQDVDSLRESLRQLDQDWRTLEYKLQQINNLSRATLGHIDRIRAMESELTRLFEMPLQVNLQDVSSHAIQMSQSMRTLLRDLQYEVANRNLANQLRYAGRGTYEQLERFIQITRPAPGVAVQYEDLKREFLLLERNWTAYQQQLRQANNRYVQRQVQRINGDMRSMHGSLYISRGQIDRDQLKHNAQILRNDIDLLMRRINLKMLTNLPIASQQLVIKAASDLDCSCNDFGETLDDEIDNVRHMYLALYDEWRPVNNSLKTIGNQQVRQSVRDVERSFDELQSILGIQFELDRRAAAELATLLSSNARQMQDDVRDFIARANRYSKGLSK